MINHFVSGGVRYHIHTPQERRGTGRRRGEPVDHPDTPYLPRLPFTDHGSRITANNRDGRRMGQQHTTTISRPDGSGAPFRSVPFRGTDYGFRLVPIYLAIGCFCRAKRVVRKKFCFRLFIRFRFGFLLLEGTCFIQKLITVD